MYRLIWHNIFHQDFSDNIKIDINGKSIMRQYYRDKFYLSSNILYGKRNVEYATEKGYEKWLQKYFEKSTNLNVDYGSPKFNRDMEIIYPLNEKYLFNLLKIASENGHLNIINYLLKPFILNKEREKEAILYSYVYDCIYYAARSGHFNITKFLIEHPLYGKYTNINNAEKRYSIIHFAVYHRNLSMIQYLMEKFKDPNNHAPINFNNLPQEGIRNIISRGEIDLLDYLIDSGLDIHHSNEEMIRYASSSKNILMVKYLYEKGAHIDNAIIYAKRYHEFEALHYLENFLYQRNFKN